MKQTEEETPPRYAHFILLLWEERHASGGQTTWRMSLEDPRTGRRVGFKDAGEMVNFLSHWMNQPELDE